MLKILSCSENIRPEKLPINSFSAGDIVTVFDDTGCRTGHVFLLINVGLLTIVAYDFTSGEKVIYGNSNTVCASPLSDGERMTLVVSE